MRIRVFLLLVAVLLAYTTPAQPAPGRVEHLASFPSKLVKPRNVDVWLPAGYPKPGKRYPVLYMHDGQNLFSPKTSYGGTAWEVDSVLSQLIQDGKARECIVVGIWNTDLRFREYAPAKPYARLSAAQQQPYAQVVPAAPLSDVYLKFLVTELKPFIDKKYATAPKRADTFIAGSSMGGLISLYAVLEYPQVFGGAACISTHWPLSVQQDSNDFTEVMVAYMQQKLPRRMRPKLYFDYGTTTLDAWYEPHQLRADSVLRAAGYTSTNWLTRKYEGAAHNEAAWQQRVAVPLQFLLAPKP
ncbi:Putative esterase [Hymenobacter gelipurpurascens]|uniref:Putative esterase n=1 Tax=Hymenobacter gelipurpurascens TaxID=89968 RepID=A0A212UCI8_9BACT|nr:alpha/beta hydrolase-fold protein [Hymenobacter gelipurpurascens]SNC75754.1 Putative esterase [Hymenobacter gelipurpurascens]